MDPDLSLVIGLMLAIFATASIVSAFSDGRAPRASALIVLVAGGLILWALNAHPEGYTLADVPEAFIRVLARYVM